MRLRLLLGGILITLLTCLLVAAPSALAATATFEASDPPGDSNGAPDLVGVSALADLDSGAVTITMRFSGALPTKWSLLDSYSVTLGSSSTVGLGCDYLLTEGAVNALASGDGSTGAPGFHWSLGGSAYSGYSTGTPSFNADRTQMTMAFTEPKLVGSKAIVCMSASVYTSDFNKKDTLGPITSNEKAAADARAKSPEVVCPRETGYLNFAGLPDQIAQGRYVPFGVRNDTPGDDYSGDPRDSVVQSRLTMTLKSEQKPFFDSPTPSGNGFGNCVAMGIPCLVLSEADATALIAAVEDDPAHEMTVDVDARTVAYRGRTYPASIPDGARTQLLKGTWDATRILVDALPKVKETAAKLPYVRGFAG